MLKKLILFHAVLTLAIWVIPIAGKADPVISKANARVKLAAKPEAKKETKAGNARCSNSPVGRYPTGGPLMKFAPRLQPGSSFKKPDDGRRVSYRKSSMCRYRPPQELQMLSLVTPQSKVDSPLWKKTQLKLKGLQRVTPTDKAESGGIITTCWGCPCEMAYWDSIVEFEQMKSPEDKHKAQIAILIEFERHLDRSNDRKHGVWSRIGSFPKAVSSLKGNLDLDYFSTYQKALEADRSGDLKNADSLYKKSFDQALTTAKSKSVFSKTFPAVAEYSIQEIYEGYRNFLKRTQKRSLAKSLDKRVEGVCIAPGAYHPMPEYMREKTLIDQVAN